MSGEELRAALLKECGDARNTGLRPSGGEPLAAWYYVVDHFEQFVRNWKPAFAVPSTPEPERDPLSPQWEDCKVCGGDHWTKDHPAAPSTEPALDAVRAAIEAMALEGPTLTMTPGVVLDIRPEELGKMIQARVRLGLAVIRIEELETIAERIGIPLVRSDAD